jgi:hypothetical protein
VSRLDVIRPYVFHLKAAAMLILILLLCQQVSRCTASEYKAQIAAIEKGNALAEASQQRHMREWEHMKSSEFAILAAQNIRERNNVLAQKDRIIADLRSGRLLWPGVQATATCQAAADPAPASESSDSGQPGLVGEAITARFAACDEVVHERNMAVELLRAERSN